MAVNTTQNFEQMRKHNMQISESVSDAMVAELAAAGAEALEKWKADTGKRANALLNDFSKEVSK